MPVPIIMPKFGFTLETCEIVRWLVKPGERVRSGDPLCEVTTDKVNMEVEATEDGTVGQILFEAGAIVPVTEVICYLLRPGETASEMRAISADQTEGGDKRATSNLRAIMPTGGASEDDSELVITAAGTEITPVARRLAEINQLDLREVQGSGPNGRIMRRDVEQAIATREIIAVGEQPNDKVNAVPAARRLATELGVDLSAVEGSGPGGRIQSADVEAAAAAHKPRLHDLDKTAILTRSVRPPTEIMSQVLPTPRPVPSGDPQETQLLARPHLMAERSPSDAPRRIVKLEGMRRTIANRLQKSFTTAPHIFLDAAIDMTQVTELRKRLKDQNKKLSVTSVLVKACGWALRRNPVLNSTLDGDEISYWNTVNIGVAVALDQGLIVPVVKGVENLSMQTIQMMTDRFVELARLNKLTLADVSEGTFTISNMGMYGVDRFTAIINPPQVAILAVGRTQMEFVPDAEGKPVAKPIMHTTLSADHRVVDGAEAARFLSDLRMVMQEPAMLAW
ncbi:MAG: dihydrolipoamide acetyltransferase family protein [Anaerolineae bacterium]